MESFPIHIRPEIDADGNCTILPEHAGKLKDCERCGFTYDEDELMEDGEKGIIVCPDCYDEPMPEPPMPDSEEE